MLEPLFGTGNISLTDDSTITKPTSTIQNDVARTSINDIEKGPIQNTIIKKGQTLEGYGAIQEIEPDNNDAATKTKDSNMTRRKKKKLRI